MINAAGINHLGQLVARPVQHRRVIIDAMAGLHPALVLDDARSVVGPDQRHSGGELDEALAVQHRALAPHVGDDRRLRVHAPHHLHLPGDGPGDHRPALFQRLDVRLVGPERLIMFAAVPHGPHHFVVLVGVDARPPVLLHDLRVFAVRKRHLRRPAKRVQPEHQDVVHVQDQPAPRGEFLAALVGERKGGRGDHVAAQAQNRFIDAVEHLQREHILPQRVRREPSEQVLVVDEPAPVLEGRRPEAPVEIGGYLDPAPRGRFLVHPIIPGVHAEDLLRQRIGGVHAAAHVRAGRHQRQPALVVLLHPQQKALGALEFFLHQFRAPRTGRAQMNHRTLPRGRHVLHHHRPPAENLVPIPPDILQGALDRFRLSLLHHPWRSGGDHHRGRCGCRFAQAHARQTSETQGHHPTEGRRFHFSKPSQNPKPSQACSYSDPSRSGGRFSRPFRDFRAEAQRRGEEDGMLTPIPKIQALPGSPCRMKP